MLITCFSSSGCTGWFTGNMLIYCWCISLDMSRLAIWAPAAFSQAMSNSILTWAEAQKGRRGMTLSSSCIVFQPYLRYLGIIGWDYSYFWESKPPTGSLLAQSCRPKITDPKNMDSFLNQYPCFQCLQFWPHHNDLNPLCSSVPTRMVFTKVSGLSTQNSYMDCWRKTASSYRESWLWSQDLIISTWIWFQITLLCIQDLGLSPWPTLFPRQWHLEQSHGRHGRHAQWHDLG